VNASFSYLSSTRTLFRIAVQSDPSHAALRGAGGSGRFGAANGLRCFRGLTSNGLETLLTISDFDRVPFEARITRVWRAGFEFHELAASSGVAHGLVEHRLHVLNVMLANDPLSVFYVVALPTTGTNGIRVSVILCDDLGADLAIAANDLELVRHGATLPESDPAEQL
jgi:hypothetical protein